MSADNTKRLDRVYKAYTKEFKDDSISLASEIGFKGEVIPTGSLLLDQALGVGGIPRGRVIEVYGSESSGKTTLCLSIISHAQKQNLLCAFIDAEGTYDQDWASRIGVDNDNLFIVEPKSLEDGFDKMTLLIKNGVDLIVFDSIAAAPALSEVEGKAGDRNIAEKARIISQYLRAVQPRMHEHQTTLLFINQIRSTMAMYGVPETTPGGVALKFAATIRMRIRKKVITVGTAKEAIGDDITIKIEKNKIGKPYKVAKTKLLYDKGFDNKTEIVGLGVELKFISKTGSWYRPDFLAEPGQNLDELPKQQGQDALLEYLLSVEGAMEKLEQEVRLHLADLITTEHDLDDIVSADDEGDTPDF